MPSFDKLAAIYDATRGLPAAEMQKVVGAIERVLKEFGCKSLIDVGVGTGRFALPLSAIGFDVIGIDISKEMVRIAREKQFDNFLFSDARSMPFRDQSFDAALAVHVLHLTASWKLVVKEICRVTKNVLIASGVEVEGFSVRWQYYQMRQELDKAFQEDGLAGGENELAKIIPPARTIIASEHPESIEADREIQFLENRGSSDSLETPTEIHKKIIENLKKEYAGKTFPRRRKELVYFWNINDLRTSFEGKPEPVRDFV